MAAASSWLASTAYRHRPSRPNRNTRIHTNTHTWRSAHSCSWYMCVGLAAVKGTLRSSDAAAQISRRWDANVGLAANSESPITLRTLAKFFWRTPCAVWVAGYPGVWAGLGGSR